MITIAIPAGGKMPDLKAELSSAYNIKDRQTRNNTITGLNKIALSLALILILRA